MRNQQHKGNWEVRNHREGSSTHVFIQWTREEAAENQMLWDEKKAHHSKMYETQCSEGSPRLGTYIKKEERYQINWCESPYWEAIQTSKGRKLPSYDAYEPAQQGNPKGAVAVSALLGLKSHSTRGKSHWSWKPGQLPRASEVPDLRGDPTTTSPLNQHRP